MISHLYHSQNTLIGGNNAQDRGPLGDPEIDLYRF